VRISRQERASSTPVSHAVLGWLFIALLAFVSVSALKAPAPLPATAPATEFSAERAMSDVRAIAPMPHPMGSAADAKVREYLLARLSGLELAPQDFSAFAIHKTPRGLVVGFPHDLVARLPGSANSKAIMLVAHYDSVDLGPGAADDGTGIAAILETVRALRASAPVPLKNDLIVLFTDGEEKGLLGAEAFASSHPWMKDVGVILNFEARGDRGPSMLFETSGSSRPLIEAFAKAVSYPIGSSLLYRLYKLIPNDTDITVFRRSGVMGLNFAFGEHFDAYHSSLDTPENLSTASLQHQGDYALDLARKFGQTDLNQLAHTAGNEIFFDWFGNNLVHYDQRWTVPGQIIATTLLILILSLTARHADLRWKRVSLAMLPSVCILVAVPLVMAAAAWLVLHVLAGRILISDSGGNACLLVAFILLGACAGVLALSRFRSRFSALELAFAGLLLLDILSWAVALIFPAGSYLIFWPLLLAMAAWVLVEILKSRRIWIAGVAGVTASILLMAPLARLLYVFLTLQWVTLAAVGLLSGLTFLASILFFDVAAPQRMLRPLALVLLIGTAALLASGTVASKYSNKHPRPDSINYSLNADDHTAVWTSYDNSADNWTSQFIAKASRPQRLPQYLAGFEYPVLSGPAPTLDIPPPVVEIKTNANDGDLRDIQMTVKSSRDADRIYMAFDNAIEPVSIRIAGRTIVPGSGSKKFHISLFGVPSSGIVVKMQVKTASKVSFWLMDQTYGLPENHPRPKDFIAGQGSDTTIVCRKYEL
jgi:Peptidase family M28